MILYQLQSNIDYPFKNETISLSYFLVLALDEKPLNILYAYNAV